tara:strand:+ start:11072 stop:12802 length:1731 start_codon:yes stop_codon:yes gene_type:complete
MEENTIMSREEINEQFNELLKGDFTILLEKVSSIKTQYDAAHRIEFKMQLAAFLEEDVVAENKEEEPEPPKEKDFKFQADESTHRFKELYNQFQEKKKEYKQALAKQEETNFTAKTKVVEDLKTLTDEEFNNFGEMFARFKTLQEDWKKIGEVNKARFQTLQTEYSHLIDKFFYNVNIHKSLQNYSFEKNSSQKKALISKIQDLISNDSIIQLEHYIKAYQKEWDEIGPTFQEEWEKVKDDYWNSVNAIYSKIREHYLKIREKQKESIEKKERLIEEAKVQFEALKESTNPKQWSELSNKLKELQQEWKKTGFSKKSKDDELWNTFRDISNEFFDHTKVLYGKLNETRDVFEEKKTALIKRAEALKDSKEWKDTTQKFLKLQEDWKKTGALRPQKDHKLWNKFRGACNSFFDNKKEYFATLDDRQEDNLKQKKVLSAEIETVKTVEELKEKIAAWWAVGYVPKKTVNSANTKFTQAINTASKTLKLSEDSKETILFEAKIRAFKTVENGEVLLQNEQRFVKEKMDKLKDEINQYENNLSFFGPSKGAQKLKEIVESKVSEAKGKLAVWEAKIKLLG